MEFTNRYNWPPEIVNAILKDRYTNEEEAPSDFSATSLLAPVQKTVLERRFPGQLRVFDVADQFWAFMGSIAHKVLEDAWHDSMHSKVEQRLYATVLGHTLSGKIDCYAGGEIRDYKTCKVFKVMKGDYTEWEIQLNIYAYLCRKNDYPVDKLKIYAIIFDWKEQDTQKSGYPKAPIIEIPLRLWSISEQEDYIQSRLRLHEKAAKLNAEELAIELPCTDREMWCDIKDYAVMKEGGQRASAVFDNMEDAIAKRQELASKANDPLLYDVVIRRTDRTRCLKWCAAAPVCCQHKAYMKERGDGEEPPERCIF